MHNTVDVDGRGQSDRVSDFLSLPWAKGRLVTNRRSTHGGLAYLEGELDAYLRPGPSFTALFVAIRLGLSMLVGQTIKQQRDAEFREKMRRALFPGLT